MISTTNIISIFYQTLLFVIGVPGNILIILTYCKRKRRTSSGVFIIALALADLGVCLLSPVEIYSYIVFCNIPSAALCKFRFYSNQGFIYTSRFLTIAVAVERYLAVCKPMSKRISPKWAAVISAACFPVAYVLALPLVISWVLRKLPDGHKKCLPDYSIPAIKWLVKLSFPATFFSCLIVVAVCYSLIYRAIKRQMVFRSRMMSRPGQSSGIAESESIDHTITSPSAQKTTNTSFAHGSGALLSEVNETNPAEQHQQQQPSFGESKTTATATDVKVALMSRPETINDTIHQEVQNETAQDKESKTKSKSQSMDSTTKMLLVVMVIYFVSFLPKFVSIVLSNKTMGNFKENYANGYEAFIFFRRLIKINHIINPFVYGFVNKRFRQDCMATLRGVKGRCFRC